MDTPADLYLTIVSVNVQLGALKDFNGRQGWRWPGLADLIRAQHPHIVLMQETGPWMEDRWAIHAQVERDLQMRMHVMAGADGGSAAVAHRYDVPWLGRQDNHARVIHGLCQVTLDIGAAYPLEVLSAHLTPYSAADAAVQMQRCVAQAYRRGGIGIIGGDINHCLLGDKEPDWSRQAPFNVSARAIGDPPRSNTIVGEFARSGGLTDVAGYLADAWGRPELRAQTGHFGGLRVDQFHVTPAVRPALVDYWTVPTSTCSDHDMIVMRIDVDRIDHSLTFNEAV